MGKTNEIGANRPALDSLRDRMKRMSVTWGMDAAQEMAEIAKIAACREYAAGGWINTTDKWTAQ